MLSPGKVHYKGNASLQDWNYDSRENRNKKLRDKRANETKQQKENRNSNNNRTFRTEFRVLPYFRSAFERNIHVWAGR